MIFPEIRVPIPDIGGFIISRGDVKYCYVYVGDRVPVGNDGKTTHPKSRCIGRIETSEDGQSELMPNTAYYELTGQAKPDLAVMEGAGRKPWHKKPENSDEMKTDSEIAMGYGIAIMLLSANLLPPTCQELILMLLLIAGRLVRYLLISHRKKSVNFIPYGIKLIQLKKKYSMM